MPWKRIGIGVLVTNLIALNAGMGYFFYKYQITNANFQKNYNAQETSVQVKDICGEECQKIITEKISQLRIDLASAAGPSAEPKISVVPTAKTAIKTGTTARPKTQTVTYVTIPGSGTGTTTGWSDLAGTEFYFNPADYPGLTTVYFEANFKLFNGNGMAYVRLYDMNHGIGVQGSDVQTNSQINGIVTSGRVSFWAGNNLIKVQAKTLTADTVVFNSGRLKITQEN